MKMKEIKEKETDHLLHELGEQRKHLFTLRTQSVTEKLEDPTQLRKARREIARLKTVLRQRELEAAKSAPAKSVEVKAAPAKASKAKAAKPKSASAKATAAK